MKKLKPERERLFRGRYRTAKEIVKRIAQEPCWRGARREDTLTHFVLELDTPTGHAQIRVQKVFT